MAFPQNNSLEKRMYLCIYVCMFGDAWRCMFLYMNTCINVYLQTTIINLKFRYSYLILHDHTICSIPMTLLLCLTATS